MATPTNHLMTAFTPTMGRRPRWTFADGLTLVGRELGRLRQDPEELVAALVFPAIMVLFGYVFGSAIQVPGGPNPDLWDHGDRTVEDPPRAALG